VNLIEILVIAAPVFIVALLFGCLWISCLRALHRVEQARDRLWDEYHAITGEQEKRHG
jgi:hypothetical protein